jgi:hypothetical protein
MVEIGINQTVFITVKIELFMKKNSIIYYLAGSAGFAVLLLRVDNEPLIKISWLFWLTVGILFFIAIFGAMKKW